MFLILVCSRLEAGRRFRWAVMKKLRIKGSHSQTFISLHEMLNILLLDTVFTVKVIDSNDTF